MREEVESKCVRFLQPFLKQLDAHVATRLVRTLANHVPVIRTRHARSRASLLSQRSEDREREGHGPAGTKRIDNLRKTLDWQAQEIGEVLAAEAKELVSREAARVPEKRAGGILDGSVAEKLDGLAPITSAKARRLRRPRLQLGHGSDGSPAGPPPVVPSFRWQSLGGTGWAERTARRPVALAASFFCRRVRKTDPEHHALEADIPTAARPLIRISWRR